MRFSELRCPGDLERLVEEVSFLPFFAGDIEGFSVEEHCPPELWFAKDVDGPWEWKGPVARRGKCVYGKFFGGKAGFVSLEWFSDFANYRRDGYDFDVRYDDGLASRKDKDIYDTVIDKGALLSKELKQICNYKKGGNKGFETVITRLHRVIPSSSVMVTDPIGQREGALAPWRRGFFKHGGSGGRLFSLRNRV